MPFAIEVVTPEGPVFEREAADFSFVPGEVGNIGVMAGHRPLLTSLRAGAMRVRTGKEIVHLAVSAGYLNIEPKTVLVLAETAEEAEEIDVARARSARERAEDRLRKRGEQIDEARARAALARALNRLQVAQTRDE